MAVMDSVRWQRVQELFHEATALPEAERQAFLRGVCAGDVELLEQVSGMIDEDLRGASLLDRELGEVARDVLHDGAETSPMPAQIGRYRVKKKLGEGGMGVVYLAEREDLGGLVAIKILRDAWVSSARRARFSSEQRFLAKLEHPSIARLYDADTLADGTPYFVMEHVEGVSLVEYCARHACSLEQRLRLFRGACDAVLYAHGQALIHRDLKPSNILVKGDGSIRLLDFGIAKQVNAFDGMGDQTKTGLLFMTPAYAAPEQLCGDPVGLYTDVYSLGVVLYELLTGQNPFSVAGQRPADVERTSAERPITKPSAAVSRAGLPRPLASVGALSWTDLDVLVLSAMHRDPERRYRSVEALIRDIDHYLNCEPLEARPDSAAYRIGKFVRRRRGALALSSIVLAMVVGIVVFFTMRLAKSRNEALAEVARTQRIERFMKRLFQGGDEAAGPTEDLRVLTLLDRGVREARSLETDPKVQAELYQTLGTLYGDLGDLDRADGLLRLALEKRESFAGRESPDVVETLIALGLLRGEQARVEEAETLIRRALDIVHRTLPPDHPLAPDAISSLGRVLIQRGKYEDAIPPLEEAIRLYAKRGDDPVDFGMTISDLAIAQFYLGRYAEAESLNRRGLDMDRKTFGETHANVADDLINLGGIQQELGHYAESEDLHRKALVITEQWFGKDHYKTASNLMLLGRALNHEGRDEEARPLLERALAINERVYGPVHPNVASTLNELGVTAKNLGRLDDAEAYFQRMLTIERTIHSGRAERMAMGLVNLAGVFSERGDHRRAEALVREALSSYAQVLPAGHVKTATARVSLGHELVLQKRFAEAEVELSGGYAILTEKASPRIGALKTAREDLVATYDALKQPDQSAKFRAELGQLGTAAADQK